MTSGSKWWQRWVVFILLLAQFSAHSNIAMAQESSPDGFHSRSNGVDAEPPLIEHDVEPFLQPGDVQVFEATVVDDEELESVKLFYRFEGESAYNQSLMKRISTSASWRSEVVVDSDGSTSLEYYIEASDRSGNRTFRGFTFNPLVRKVPEQRLAQDNEAAQRQAAQAAPIEASNSSNRRVLYYVLGALAVGVVAGLASSAGGDSDGSNGGDAQCCELTLTVAEPF